LGTRANFTPQKILNISEDLPIVIEIVDSEQKIDTFLPVLDEMIGSGLVTLEKVQVLALRRDKNRGYSRLIAASGKFRGVA